jgi:hypothetical protein
MQGQQESLTGPSKYFTIILTTQPRTQRLSSLAVGVKKPASEPVFSYLKGSKRAHRFFY